MHIDKLTRQFHQISVAIIVWVHGYFREFKFSLFGKQRQFREFIVLWHINLNTTYIKFNRYDTAKSMKISTPQKLKSIWYSI